MRTVRTGGERLPGARQDVRVYVVALRVCNCKPAACAGDDGRHRGHVRAPPYLRTLPHGAASAHVSWLLGCRVTAAAVSNPAYDAPPERSARLLTRRGRRLKKRQQRRLEENSNAVICPNFFEKLNARLSKEDGSATAFAWFVRSIGVILPLPAPVALGWFVGNVAKDEHNARQALVTLWYSCFCVSAAILSLVQIEQLRRVIQPGEHLEQLGLGTQKISERALADLNRWQTCWLRVPKSIGRGLLVAEVCAIVVAAVSWGGSWTMLFPVAYFICESTSSSPCRPVR